MTVPVLIGSDLVSSSGAVTTFTVTTVSDVPLGSLLVIAFYANTNGRNPLSVSDPSGNIYKLIWGESIGFGNQIATISFWSTVVSSALPSGSVITANFFQTYTNALFIMLAANFTGVYKAINVSNDGAGSGSVPTILTAPATNLATLHFGVFGALPYGGDGQKVTLTDDPAFTSLYLAAADGIIDALGDYNNFSLSYFFEPGNKVTYSPTYAAGALNALWGTFLVSYVDPTGEVGLLGMTSSEW